MSDYRLTMNLESVNASSVEVRAWIDEPGGDLSSEQEVLLVQEDEASWSGLFSVEGEAIFYRVGICAEPGSCWRLSVRDASQGGEDGEELMFDSDMLTMEKEWLVGSCEVASLALAEAPAASVGLKTFRNGGRASPQ